MSKAEHDYFSFPLIRFFVRYYLLQDEFSVIFQLRMMIIKGILSPGKFVQRVQYCSEGGKK